MSVEGSQVAPMPTWNRKKSSASWFGGQEFAVTCLLWPAIWIVVAAAVYFVCLVLIITDIFVCA